MQLPPLTNTTAKVKSPECEAAKGLEGDIHQKRSKIGISSKERRQYPCSYQHQREIGMAIMHWWLKVS